MDLTGSNLRSKETRRCSECGHLKSKQMKELIKQALESVKEGARFKVDLVKRNLYVGKKCLIKEGKFEGTLDGLSFSIYELENLYEIYKHSRPSERSDNKRRCYFRALKCKELSEDDMLYGVDREVAQFKLETYLLAWILSGLFVWDEESMGKWFWQSQNDKDLVILRNWIDGK